jgi:hypothetical protein
MFVQLLLLFFDFLMMATYTFVFLLCDCVLQVNLPTCDIPPPSTSLSVPAQCSRTHYPGAWLLLTNPSSGMTLGAPHSLTCSKADVQCYRMCAWLYPFSSEQNTLNSLFCFLCRGSVYMCVYECVCVCV